MATARPAPPPQSKLGDSLLNFALTHALTNAALDPLRLPLPQERPPTTRSRGGPRRGRQPPGAPATLDEAPQLPGRRSAGCPATLADGGLPPWDVLTQPPAEGAPLPPPRRRTVADGGLLLYDVLTQPQEGAPPPPFRRRLPAVAGPDGQPGTPRRATLASHGGDGRPAGPSAAAGRARSSGLAPGGDGRPSTCPAPGPTTAAAPLRGPPRLRGDAPRACDGRGALPGVSARGGAGLHSARLHGAHPATHGGARPAPHSARAVPRRGGSWRWSAGLPREPRAASEANGGKGAEEEAAGALERAFVSAVGLREKRGEAPEARPAEGTTGRADLDTPPPAAPCGRAGQSPSDSSRKSSVAPEGPGLEPRGSTRGAKGRAQGPVSGRVHRLTLRRQEALLQARADEEGSERWRKFRALPKREAGAIRRAFEYFDQDKSGFLEGNEIGDVLREFGLRGNTAEEKKEIMRICREATRCASDSGDDVSVDMVSFALDVIPEARRRLGEIQATRLLQRFELMDTTGAGRLKFQQCMEISRSLGLDRSIMEGVMADMVGDKQHEITFGEMQEMIVRSREMVERIVSERERKIKEETGIGSDVFAELRQDLIPLHETFDRHVGETAPGASCKQAEQVLADFGILPKDPEERHQVAAQLMGLASAREEGLLSFGDVVGVVRGIRAQQRQARFSAHARRFERFDRQRNGRLAVDEVSRFLTAAGCCPRSRREQEEMAELISGANVDSSGSVSFEEVQVLHQRLEEKLQSIRYDEEVEYALTVNFTESQVHEFRWVFDTLDADSSGMLSLIEVKKGLALMRKKVSDTLLDETFSQLDIDQSGELNFREFLDLMRLLRDEEGIFSEEMQLFPKQPCQLDAQIMQRALGCFSLSKAYVASLSSEDLLTLFCDTLDLKKDDDIYAKLNVKNTGELFEEARRLGRLWRESAASRRQGSKAAAPGLGP